MESKIPVFLITGYLGSGKTTLLNELLHQEQRKLAVVVNDMGQVNVDARLVQEQGMKSLDTTMVELSNGCICCT
ncbi:MAG: GTP-binding protein, partial [Lachnospiraceae bacterium]|nr:GTP-binding protein [Lachnospiraceae bacterium]